MGKKEPKSGNVMKKAKNGRKMSKMGGKVQKEIRNFLPISGNPSHSPTSNEGFSPAWCHIQILKITPKPFPLFQPQTCSFVGFILFPFSPGLNSPWNYRFHKLTDKNADAKS